MLNRRVQSSELRRSDPPLNDPIVGASNLELGQTAAIDARPDALLAPCSAKNSRFGWSDGLRPSAWHCALGAFVDRVPSAAIVGPRLTVGPD